jgi:hypothetical protein
MDLSVLVLVLVREDDQRTGSRKESQKQGLRGTMGNSIERASLSPSPTHHLQVLGWVRSPSSA